MSNLRLMRADERTAETPSYLDRALTLQAQSRHRSAMFSAKQYAFYDPGWDILLHLFIGYERGAPVAVKEACQAVGVSPPVGLRWLDFMEQQGLLRRWDDEIDRERSLIGLTPAAMEAMLQYLDAV